MAKMVTVLAPNPAFEGEVGSVRFSKGSARVDTTGADWISLRTYFQSAGYVVDGERLNEPFRSTPNQEPQPDHVRLGTEAQDASLLEDLDEDQADEPELEQGDVVKESDDSDTDESEPGESEPETEVEPASTDRPATSTKVQAWRDFAVAQGADPIEVAGLTRDQLIERFGA